MWVGCQLHAPAVLPRGNSHVPITQEAGWAPGWVWMSVEKRKSLHPPDFEPRTVQLVDSRYIDYAILAPCLGI
jgi:hypothetical protein